MTSFFVPGVPATKGSWRAIRGRRGNAVLLPDNEREKPWALAVACERGRSLECVML